MGPNLRGNSVNNCLIYPQVKGMKTMNSSESYSCLTVDREYEF